MNSSINPIKIFITSKDTNLRIDPIDYNELKITKKNYKRANIVLNPKKIKQTFLGFGGAFTESSASIYSKLDNIKKQELLTAYFNCDIGHSYSFGRTHINSCDFSLGNYSYTQRDNDLKLETFSIDHDRKIIIPFIKDAIKEANQPIRIMASPWSPPSWMKTNNEMNNGGKLKDHCRDSWANYYCRYIEEYEKEGILIWGLSVQNEPAAKQIWDSCLYTAEEERDFIRDYLGPALYKNNFRNKNIIIWDHNRDLMLDRAKIILNDLNAAKYIWGTGFHWYNGDHFENVQKVHDEFPNKHLIFTEGTQEGGPHIGSWKLGERYARSIINDLNRWTVAWLDWNLILDSTGGPNHVNNFCSAPIIVDNNEILYQSSYYYIGHFSRYIKAGDQIIHSEIDTKELITLSALNSSGTITTIIMNEKNYSIDFNLKTRDTSYFLSIPNHSIITFIS